ncbi:hypothetical protein POM88_030519 [Heracleum sosnowskyi]|uniref:Exocyst complex subunit EXOC6/Sec15 C-terminal domain-containing protein n=1 Tax=Heracleum sosnowskyi TaxID=360622 RepID=A0AAD8MI56_9APIA|nr:hypothetical protein POM88_030519 [Heracleum sosnowskyi]
MYAIGGSPDPTINSQGNRYLAPVSPFAKEVTKRVDTNAGQWRSWNWSWDKNLKCWDPRGARGQERTLVRPYNQLDRVYSLSINGHRLVVATAGRHVNIYDLRNMSQPEQRRESSLKYQTRCVRCYPNQTASRDKAYLALLTLVNNKLDEFMALTDNVKWTSDDLPQHANEYISEVIIYLDTLLSTAQQILPLDALYKVGCGALEHISNSYMEAFLSDIIKMFNDNAVTSISYDLKELETFADERFQSTVCCVFRVGVRSTRVVES